MSPEAAQNSPTQKQQNAKVLVRFATPGAMVERPLWSWGHCLAPAGPSLPPGKWGLSWLGPCAILMPKTLNCRTNMIQYLSCH